VTLRDITDLAGCRAVVAVQEQVWGAGSEIVPASVLLVSAKRGGILVGAYDGGNLSGFVWSMPGWRDGAPTHWSHMLGVVRSARGKGVGERLKIAQRERALAQGVELVEWTFDPLQAPNAHLNFTRLGCVATTYLVDAYGDMAGPLHRGTPTDRLVAEWRLRAPHVERRLAAGRAGTSALVARSSDVRDARPAITTAAVGEWIAAGGVDTALDTRRVSVPVPPRFTDMQEQAVALASAWRLATREAFTAYFARGYRAVDFFLDRESGGGEYLLDN
jgi:predicted GNAT superfamily acetyltransferase